MIIPVNPRHFYLATAGAAGIFLLASAATSLILGQGEAGRLFAHSVSRLSFAWVLLSLAVGAVLTLLHHHKGITVRLLAPLSALPAAARVFSVLKTGGQLESWLIFDAVLLGAGVGFAAMFVRTVLSRGGATPAGN